MKMEKKSGGAEKERKDEGKEKNMESKRGRVFLPPLLATEFPSRERERGEEREIMGERFYGRERREKKERERDWERGYGREKNRGEERGLLSFFLYLRINLLLKCC